MTLKDKKLIAITDDDGNIRASLERTLFKHFDDIEIKQFSTTIELKKFVLNNPNTIDVLILDIHFGIGETGLDILPYIKSTSQMTQIILLTAMEKAYGQSVTESAGDMIFDFMSKPVTETELVIKIKKALASNNTIADRVKDLENKNTVLSSILDNANLQNAAGRAFEKEVYSKLKNMSKIFMQGEFEPKNNIIINGQEIDTIAFTAAPLPFFCGSAHGQPGSQELFQTGQKLRRKKEEIYLNSPIISSNR